MASDAPPTFRTKTSVIVPEVVDLVAYTKKELDADAERQAKVSAAGSGGLESQTGATLDLSHRDIHALPVELIALIKDKVERCGTMTMAGLTHSAADHEAGLRFRTTPRSRCRVRLYSAAG